jgi:glycosyltransferase involved in cell wall biosynthesis
MPVYNEQDALPEVLAELRAVVLDRIPECELVIVDDHSTDGTPALLAALDDPRVRVIRAERNRGHGPSVAAALRAARGEWLLQLDSDAQVVLEDFWRMWPEREHADLVLGIRRPRHDPAHRLVLSVLLRAVVRVLGRGRGVHDVNVPFKLLRRELWDRLAPAMPEEPIVPSALIVLGALRTGARITEMPIVHRARSSGTTVLIPTRLLWLSLRAAVELATFRPR